MSVPYTTAEMAAATRRYGYPRGSEFDDGVRVGPTFPGFVSNEVAANLSMSGIPEIQKNCPPLDDCQTVMGYGALLAPVYSYSIRVGGAGNAPAGEVSVNKNFPKAFVSVSTFPKEMLDNAITSAGTVTIGAKQYASWDFDWPRTVNIVSKSVFTNSGTVSVHGVDIYNQPMTETYSLTSGTSSDPQEILGVKAFKSVIGVTGSGGEAGTAFAIEPSLVTFGFPYFTVVIVGCNFNQIKSIQLPMAPYVAGDSANAESWNTAGSDFIYKPGLATATSPDVRGTFTLENGPASPELIPLQGYCMGFDSFIKQQIINKSPYGRYQVPAGLPGEGSWVTVPTPAWLISPQTQYGAKQYWGNPAI